MSERLRALRGPAFVLFACAFMLAPLLHPVRIGTAIVGTDTYRTHDWLEVAKLDHVARNELLAGAIPWWNPMFGGGFPQAAHPSDGSLGPLILPSLLFGEVAGMKLVVALAALVGAFGLRGLLLHRLGLDDGAATLGACFYALSGWLPARAAVGFYEVCLMAALPAVLACVLSPRPRDWGIGALLLWPLALQLQLAMPIVVLWTGCLLLLGAARARGRTPLLAAGAVFGVAFLLGGIKFLPMIGLLRQAGFRALDVYPQDADAWYRSVDQFVYGLTHPPPDVPAFDRDGNPRASEYASIACGWPAVALAVLGAARSLRRKEPGFPYLISGALLLWMAFGPWAPLDAFRPLFELPLFSSMRGPLRYLNHPVWVSICVLAAVGWRHLPIAPRLRPLSAAICVLLTLPSALPSRALYRTAFAFPIDPLPAMHPVRAEGLLGRSEAGADRFNLRKYQNLLRGVPTIYEAEDLPIRVAALPASRLRPDGLSTPEPAYRGEVFALDGAAGRGVDGSVRIAEQHGAFVRIEADLREPGIVLLNQNARVGWTCTAPISQVARNRYGLLGFEVNALPASVECRYRPPQWLAGAMLSSVGAALLFGLLATGRSGRSSARNDPLRSPRSGGD